MTVLAQDPAVRDARGRPLTARLPVPADFFAPGPRGHRLHLVDYDASQNVLRAPLPSSAGFEYVDRYRALGRHNSWALVMDPHFRAQHVFAVAARTLAAFERALGRRIRWGFSDHELFLVPHAFEEENAFYSPDDRALLFGYFEGRGGRVFTCLSHDIVAHEMTHAILDGLRPGYEEPGLPDQPAFHEAFADVVALLSIMSQEELVDLVLSIAVSEPVGMGDRSPRIAAEALTVASLRRSVLTGVGEEFGRGIGSGRALRQSADWMPERDWRTIRAEAHLLGEVLVWVMLDVLLKMWTERLKALIDRSGTLDRRRAAEEGAKAAGHLLQMAIRAIDYCPPVEFEFEDFAAAILRADQVVAPDDRHRYRDAVERAFERVGIEAESARISSLSRTQLVAPGALNVGALRQSVDEVYRFIWANASRLGLRRGWRIRVGPLAVAERVGPDGLIVSEIVVSYTQSLDLTVAELPAQVRRPPGLSEETEVELLGGGALVFDQFGLLRFHAAKPLQDWRRQSRRLRYLAGAGLVDSRGRLGFSLGERRGQRFAALHRPRIDAERGFS